MNDGWYTNEDGYPIWYDVFRVITNSKSMHVWSIIAYYYEYK